MREIWTRAWMRLLIVAALGAWGFAGPAPVSAQEWEEDEVWFTEDEGWFGIDQETDWDRGQQDQFWTEDEFDWGAEEEWGWGDEELEVGEDPWGLGADYGYGNEYWTEDWGDEEGAFSDWWDE